MKISHLVISPKQVSHIGSSFFLSGGGSVSRDFSPLLLDLSQLREKGTKKVVKKWADVVQARPALCARSTVRVSFLHLRFMYLSGHRTCTHLAAWLTPDQVILSALALNRLLRNRSGCLEQRLCWHCVNVVTVRHFSKAKWIRRSKQAKVQLVR